MRADIFYRQFNRRRESLGEISVVVPAGADLVSIIIAAGRTCGRALERRRGARTGVYQVQTDEGIWSALDGGALTHHTAAHGCRVRAQARFTTWDELEAQELAARSAA